MKRLFDFLIASLALLLLSPVLLLLAILVLADGHGPALFRQTRIGLHGKPFTLLKFRSMRPLADQQGLLTVGQRDPRITRIGYFLRKYKLDELPQLWNVWKGDMSLVGPRPEVERYVKLYNTEQQQVLGVRPGITDFASLYYFEENRILATHADPEAAYIQEIMPHKLELNLEYIRKQSLWLDTRILFLTVWRILR